jgi:hypothetical protein
VNSSTLQRVLQVGQAAADGRRGQVFARCRGGDGVFFHHGNKQAQGDGIEFHGVLMVTTRARQPCWIAMAASRISVLRAGRVCA